jgi:hypothetical protein
MGLMLRRFVVALLGVLVSVVLGVAPASAFFTHVFSSSFGSQGSGAGQMSLALDSGVAVNYATHDVYVADTENARVDQFSAAGAFIRAWGWGVADGLPQFEMCTLVCQAGLKGSAPGEFELPTLIAVDNSGGPSEGDVYVGDTGDEQPLNTTGTNLVQKFTSAGVLMAGWGVGGQLNGSTSSTPKGPFSKERTISGIAVDQAGNLLVDEHQAQTAGTDLFKFAQDGTPATGIEATNGGFPQPLGLGVDGDGNFYVSRQNLVEKLSPAGVSLGQVNASHNSSFPGFTRGLAVDSVTGDVYIDTQFGSVVEHYAPSCDPRVGCAPVVSFGGGVLSGAAGLAVDSPAGIVYVADAGNGRVAAFGTPPALPPSVASASVSAVAATSVELHSQVNPNLYDTHFHYQYVDDATFQASGFANASVVPASDVDLGAGGVAVSASAHPQGLQPGTVYHYRIVADNGNGGPQTGPAGVFTTQSLTGSFQLPDGRGYEQVTPTEKGDGYIPIGVSGNIFMGHVASVSGDRFAYVTEAGFPGSQAGLPIAYVASRGANGWSSLDLIPPQAPDTELDALPPFAAGYSADLSKAAFIDGLAGTNGNEDSPPLVSGEPRNNVNLFLRDVSGGSYQLMDLTPAGVTPAAAQFQGASTDLSHIVFASRAQLTPEANNTLYYNLFQWAGGSVSLVDQIPGGSATRCGGGGPACIVAPQGGTLGQGFSGAGGFLNAVSPDGSKIFFAESNEEGQLYMREDGTTTVEVSASQKNNGTGPGGRDPKGPLPPTYWPASPDGSRVFFTSCEQLTNDSTATFQGENGRTTCRGDVEQDGEDLYRFDTATGVLSDLTVDHTPGDVRGADVVGVLGSSADGSYVYFVANGVLAAGASPGDCAPRGEESPGRSCNVYLAHGGVTTFIARVDSSDTSDWSSYGTRFGSFTARVTPDGTHLAFDSVRSLTGYDNTVAAGGSCGASIYEAAVPYGAACPEVFLYDAGSGVLSCASCNPTGVRPIGPSMLDGVLTGHGGEFRSLPRGLSEDGRRVFFDSSDALVPGDVNGKRDVYEYEGGRVYLISSGTSGADSTFYDASASGNDVFFTTVSQLVRQDTDRKFDVYDARVGGGFPAPAAASAPPCAGEGCRPAPVGPPAGAALGSAGLAGGGNLAAPAGGGGVRVRVLTRAQRLAAALRVCRHEPRRRRTSCVARARRLYGPVKAGKSTKRSVKGGK